MLGRITGFTLEIAASQGKRKLSQDCAADKREQVIRGLREREGDDERATPATMSALPVRIAHAAGGPALEGAILGG